MDKKLTDNEIKKALECCADSTIMSCAEKGCPFRKFCQEDTNALEKASLELINRKDAEIEQLRDLVIEGGREQDSLSAEIERLKLESVQSQNTRINELELKLLSSEGLCNKQEREIEQLRQAIAANNKELDRWSEIVCEKNEEINILYKDALEEIKTAKSEAIKEFAERLKTYKMQPFNYDRYLVPLVAIDEVAKEMTGQNDFNRKG